MKITFEGNTFHDVLNQIEDMLVGVAAVPKNISKIMSENAKKSAIPSGETGHELQGPGPEAIATAPPVDKSVDKPGDKPPKKPVDRVAAMNKARAVKDAKKAAAAALEPEQVAEPFAEAKAALDPAEIVKIRQKTIEDLQTAYANGLQKEVFELLSRFGNGAKSFRELTPEAFMPIRDAIDHGALT